MSKFSTNWWRNRLRMGLAGLSRRAFGLLLVTKEEVTRFMRRRVKPRFWGFMIAVTLIVFLASFAVLRVRFGYGARRLEQAQSERNALKAEAEQLERRLEYAQTDEYVVRIARDELNMIMPGEIRYVNGTR